MPKPLNVDWPAVRVLAVAVDNPALDFYHDVQPICQPLQQQNSCIPSYTALIGLC